MKKIPLSKFISNLDNLIKNPMAVYKQTIIEVIYAVLWQMARYTIIDTGEARYTVIGAFARRYGFDSKELNDAYYDYWGNAESEGRGWGKNPYKTSITEQESNKYYKMTQYMDDEGLYEQEIGNPRYPSESHSRNTGRDNSYFIPRHISYVADVFNANQLASLEKLDYNKLVNELCLKIEENLFK